MVSLQSSPYWREKIWGTSRGYGMNQIHIEKERISVIEFCI